MMQTRMDTDMRKDTRMSDNDDTAGNSEYYDGITREVIAERRERDRKAMDAMRADPIAYFVQSRIRSRNDIENRTNR